MRSYFGVDKFGNVFLGDRDAIFLDDISARKFTRHVIGNADDSHVQNSRVAP